MVSGRTPRKQSPRRSLAVPDAAAIRKLLRELASRDREMLMEPWRERLAASEDLRREMDRVVANLQVFFNKWTVEVIIVLGQHGTLRFSELREALGGISSRTLTQRLRELEEQGLVDRRMYDEMPIRVEYSLTPKGLDVAALALPLVLYLGAEG